MTAEDFLLKANDVEYLKVFNAQTLEEMDCDYMDKELSFFSVTVNGTLELYVKAR